MESILKWKSGLRAKLLLIGFVPLILLVAIVLWSTRELNYLQNNILAQLIKFLKFLAFYYSFHLLNTKQSCTRVQIRVTHYIFSDIESLLEPLKIIHLSHSNQLKEETFLLFHQMKITITTRIFSN